MINNKEKIFLSAVIYIHNNEDTIKEFLKTVNNSFIENFERYEIVCVNDCSTDNTVKEINAFCDDESVKSLTLVNTSFFQGTENAMIAGCDIAIGDFVFEFDSTVLDFTPELIMEVYEKSLRGSDIVFASPKGTMRTSSKIFYALFNRFSSAQYKIKTQRFSIISRRGINRVKSMGIKTVYRKAVYASCGLNVTDVEYTPIKNVENIDSQKHLKKGLAANSLIMFTDIAYKVSVTLSSIMSGVLLLAGIYTIAVYFSSQPIAGWTTTMLVMSFGFFGLFVLLAFVVKYLSVILNLVFTHKQYVVESIQKITR